MRQGGGQLPFWSPDGNTVYYWTLAGGGGAGGDDIFNAAHIQREPTPVVLSRETLFTGDYVAGNSDLHPEGDLLVIPQIVGAATAPQGAAPRAERFIVVVNWFEELLARVGN